MKPTAEQLKDPNWWDENAPVDAQFWSCEHFRKHEGYSEFYYANGEWRETGLDTIEWHKEADSMFAARPTHSVDATEKVTGQKFDQGKPMMGLIPPRAEMAVAEVLTFGANKYGPDNWRHVEDLERRYIDAAMRHINAYRAGFERDFESDMHHLAHAICCLMFVAEIDLEDSEK